ncbi:hypothetical protein [Saccharopolyspora hattusasensis]|uniref:hypothetical protein n=1 Tax=Saccharopolyspora hattusasensis TaxID=1128679 RepID=UPI003D96EADF
MKRRLREGAKLVVIDPRRIDLVRSPHIEAAHHLPVAPGTNVAMVNALAHVVVTEPLPHGAHVLRQGVAFCQEPVGPLQNSLSLGRETQEPVATPDDRHVELGLELAIAADNAGCEM